MSPHEPQRRSPKWRAALGTALVAVFVAVFTLLPSEVLPVERYPSFFCVLGCGTDDLRDLVSNFLLFIPVGWVASYWARPRRALIACLFVTIIIEGLQVAVITGRDSSLRDILSNTAGGAAGIGLYLRGTVLRWPSPTAALRLAVLGSFASLILLCITGLGIRLAPSSRPWYAQWAPDLGNYVIYPGKVLDVDVEGKRPPYGQIAEPVAMRQAMKDGRPWIRIRAVSGISPGRSAPMFMFSDEAGREQLFVGQDSLGLLLHLRSAFEAWGLRELVVRQPMFPGKAPGDTVTVNAGIASRALTIRSQSGTRQLSTAVPLTVGLGWSAIMPFRYPIFNEWALFNAVWLAGLIFPIGYWAGRWSPRRAPVLLILVLMCGLGAIPFLTTAAPTTRPEWLGAVFGAAVSWIAGILSLRRVPPET